MPYFIHTATLPANGPEADQGHVVDLALVEIGEDVRLYAATRGGVIDVWNVAGDGPATLIEHNAATQDPASENLLSLTILEGVDGPHLMTGGVFGHAMTLFGIDTQTGGLGGQPVTLGVAQSGFLNVTVQVGGDTYLYTVERGASEIQRHTVDEDFNVVSYGALAQAGSVAALATATIGGNDFLLVATSNDETLSSIRVLPDGSTSDETGNVTALTGPGFDTPTALAVAEVDGVSYVILAAAGSSSLSVMALDATGGLTPTDHVLDRLDTRFQGVTALDVVTRGTDVFVLAGGADDGISLLTLLPGGRLHHLAYVADTELTALDNVAALAGLATDTGLTVLSGAASETGISQFEIDLGDYGGAYVSAAGQETLQGSEGDDILMAGTGTVHLIGNAGADTFIFDSTTATENGTLGHIDDFDPEVDAIDLSSVLSLYGLDGVQINADGTGASLALGPYTLEITAAANATLSLDDFTSDKMTLADRPTLDPWNHPAVLNAPSEPDPDPDPDPEPEPDPEQGLTLIGDSDKDTLLGSDQDDFLYGMENNDRLEGNSGNDQLDGGTGADFLDGGNGSDTLDGGDGNDEVRGGGGNDLLSGGAGSDFLIGNSGNDVLNGSGLSDLVFGGPGDDFVNGGWGYDRINGGTGADKFFHVGIFDHGSDWIQDFNPDEGDSIFAGIVGATKNDFQVNFANAQAGDKNVSEAFVIYKPTKQVLWVLLDGENLSEIPLQINGSSDLFDLMI